MDYAHLPYSNHPGSAICHHPGDSLSLFPVFNPLIPRSCISFCSPFPHFGRAQSQKSFIKSCMGATFFETLYVWKCLYATFTRCKFDSVFQENSIMKAYFHLASLVNVTIFLVMHALKRSLSATFQVSFTLLLYLWIGGKFQALWLHSVILLSCAVSASKTSLLDQTRPVSPVRSPLPSSLSLNYLTSHSRGRSWSQPLQRLHLPNPSQEIWPKKVKRGKRYKLNTVRKGSESITDNKGSSHGMPGYRVFRGICLDATCERI